MMIIIDFIIVTFSFVDIINRKKPIQSDQALSFLSHDTLDSQLKNRITYLSHYRFVSFPIHTHTHTHTLSLLHSHEIDSLCIYSLPSHKWSRTVIPIDSDSGH
jgi:hypothetical protein